MEKKKQNKTDYTPSQKKPKQLNQYAKYTGLAFQMLATIGLCIFLGLKIDEWTGNSSQTFLIIFSLIGVIGSIYQVIREFT